MVAFYCGQQLQMKVRLSETLFWPIGARAQALRKQAAASTEAELTSALVKDCLHKRYFLLQNNDITIHHLGVERVLKLIENQIRLALLHQLMANCPLLVRNTFLK